MFSSSGIEPVITCEVNRTRAYLRQTCENTEKQCYKEQLWSKMIAGDSNTLSFDKFGKLLTFLNRVKIADLDPYTVALSENSLNNIEWGQRLQEELCRCKKFVCRSFTNDDLRHLVRFLGFHVNSYVNIL